MSEWLPLERESHFCALTYIGQLVSGSTQYTPSSSQ